MADVELCFLQATDLANKLRRREVSAVEVVEAHLQQIERVNPKVNAIVTLVPEQATCGKLLLRPPCSIPPSTCSGRAEIRA